MSDSSENLKYKWTPESTTLLVSVWTDKQVQKQLEYTTKPQLIWESVARYMRKKGYNVSGKQCRSRMKQVLVCYREAKRVGTRAGVEQYYESIDKVLKNKRLENININGLDTVDSSCSANIKSPPKDAKTNKNIQMKHKYRDPLDVPLRTEALSPSWEMPPNDEDYPDSPESNETVLARPYCAFSPIRDAATNTARRATPMTTKFRQNSMPLDESPIRETYRQNSLPNNRFSEVPYQNTVQNVQNQIIQENMQQNQALLSQNLLQAENHLLRQNLLQINPAFQQNLFHTVEQGVSLDQVSRPRSTMVRMHQNPQIENILRTQNQLQQSAPVDNRAMPQEPRKAAFRQNFMENYKQYRETIPSQHYDPNLNLATPMSPSYSPDLAPNLNDAFCQTPKTDKAYMLNETFERPSRLDRAFLDLPNADLTTLTNNATFNDDTLSIEFLQESPTPSENNNNLEKKKDFAMNTDTMPDAPFRKKKAQKLEQLMISALSSQSDVVNKILAAQNDMVSRFLDLDRDRQNRLENRLDHLLDVVHASVINKSPERDVADIPQLPADPRITSLVPPPKPGVVPPKLDLVPPKPCRVPCTMANTRIEMVNQKGFVTRPGVISPGPVAAPRSPNSPKKQGTIWSKLGPVSQSPFVRAQRELGLRVNMNFDAARTQSSAERRIAQQVSVAMDSKSLIRETATFLQMEKQLEERIEGARLQEKMSQELTARRRLFTQREPTTAMILTAAFLEAERENYLNDNYSTHNNNRYTRSQAERGYQYNGGIAQRRSDENLLAGQGESYERLRQLNTQEQQILEEPSDSSTPARPRLRPPSPVPPPKVHPLRERDSSDEEPRQTIQQLARLVMNSARWRNAAGTQDNRFGNRLAATRVPSAPSNLRGPNQQFNAQSEGGNQIHPGQPTGNIPPPPKPPLRDRYSYPAGDTKFSKMLPGDGGRFSLYEKPPAANNLNALPPMGFISRNPGDPIFNSLNSEGDIQKNDYLGKMGFVKHASGSAATSEQPDIRFQDNRNSMDDDEALRCLQQLYAERIYSRNNDAHPPFMTNNGNAIMARNRDLIEQYVHELLPNKQFKDTDSENDEEFLDTTGSMPPTSSSRRGSITSTGTAGSAATGKSGKSDAPHCVIS
ncbi:uncharacterized protein LOC107274478 [Cephus cinctus]|uniref:Uncharacterized protein LOC107274478 n=1 Tax=Cephus cinctus TaxID=211228 RepID=A0AAJ7FUM3_CEPCN|nr:uncharacterized protein LOC107274478 [Cephus cinctus]